MTKNELIPEHCDEGWNRAEGELPKASRYSWQTRHKSDA